MRLILTRPREESEALGRLLEARGHSVLIEPMLRIEALPDAELDLDGVAALLLTSANGARILAGRTARRDLPVLAVGDATARAARDAGFETVASADGDVVALAALVRRRLRPADGVLLHVAGSAVAGDLAGDLAGDGYQVRRAVLYRSARAERLSPGCRAALAAGEIDGVVFFSPRSAAGFANLLRREELVDCCRGIDLYGLSQAVARAAGDLPWRRQQIAEMPQQDALLALL
ncbi:MAG: uroporphyrinogen-III synthase [Alphaproteobacteria bacterium]|jgi:uroporphyrinogen-III synthase|nr:uroporphyrinogen-III synthase [Alphaproteobacteria bacterium]MDP6568038.1 uroporphyrinogen-III synthase [Alphaproteobacteria bacterium]MDP6814178.1 uroporphyrinogen-III synthase [Alphaproteobacteria bacterium]